MNAPWNAVKPETLASLPDGLEMPKHCNQAGQEWHDNSCDKVFEVEEPKEAT